MKQIRPVSILVKALLLFILANIVFAAWNPPVGKISAYQWVFPGRARLPFGSGPGSYNISVDDLDAMFASHALAAPKQPGEYRVVLLGDSSVWGELLYANETLSAQLNKMGFDCGGKTLRFYNLGFPHPSVVKDLLLLDKAMQYKPDMVIWVFTLQALRQKALNPFLLVNYDRIMALKQQYGLKLELSDPAPTPRTFFEKTIIGQREQLARLLLLQTLGPVWAGTGLDVAPIGPYDKLSNDQKGDIRFGDLDKPADITASMMLDYLAAAGPLSNNLPVLYVNEPVFIATGANSQQRYNTAYPRWAYDQYRQFLASQAQTRNWRYLDLWNTIPAQEFSDNPLHFSAHGESLMAAQLKPLVEQSACH